MAAEELVIPIVSLLGHMLFSMSHMFASIIVQIVVDLEFFLHYSLSAIAPTDNELM